MSTEISTAPRAAEEIEADIAMLAPAWSAGWARYSNNGTWTHQRKALLSHVSMKCRAYMARSGEKITETRIDEMAHADPEYTAFLARHEEGAAEWAALDLQKQMLLSELRRLEVPR